MNAVHGAIRGPGAPFLPILLVTLTPVQGPLPVTAQADRPRADTSDVIVAPDGE